MYSDAAQWAKIRHRVLVLGHSIRGLSRSEGISRNTIKKILQHPKPQHYVRPRRTSTMSRYNQLIADMLSANAARNPRDRYTIAHVFRHIRDEHGFGGSYSMVHRYCRSISHQYFTLKLRASIGHDKIDDVTFVRAGRSFRLKTEVHANPTTISLQLQHDRQSQKVQEAQQWIERLRSDKRSSALCKDDDSSKTLYRDVHAPKQRIRNRAISVLMYENGFSNNLIAKTLEISRRTSRSYIRRYNVGGVEALFKSNQRKQQKADRDDLKQAAFRLLHEPPKNHGINRSSWNLQELRTSLATQGFPVGSHTLRTIIHEAGWKWKKAKVMLTSQDPAYNEKLTNIRSILQRLTSDEAFFSIDEFGPFSVKMKPGRLLTAPGQQPTVPQWQKSKGCMIMTAALELGSNQITHFYSQRKNTTEMIRMMNVLLEQYAERKTIYLSWDAASWHVSKKLFQAVAEHNAKANSLCRPVVETVPLPAGAQFLNVIEAVFSGMARAIIHNSDYSSVEETQEAINSYFNKRNQHFQEHPKKAGNKIWGNEKVVAVFSASNNCKDPRWR